MLRFFILIAGICFLVVSCFVLFDSKKTFEAKFKNIDGLPRGAPVTALGVKIGEVVKTKPVDDGIIVTIKVTNNSVPKFPPGTQLAITSFRPGQGKVLEVIFPKENDDKTKAFIIEEPVTIESWMQASLQLLENLKNFSKFIITNVTPENIRDLREFFSKVSSSVDETAINLKVHSDDLGQIKQKLALKVDEANKLLTNLHRPISSFNNAISSEQTQKVLKNELNDFSVKLTDIGNKVSAADLPDKIQVLKSNILDYLNSVNASLAENDRKITSSTLPEKLMDFNENIENLNLFYDLIDAKPLGLKIKQSAEKARDIVTKTEEQTSKLK